MIGGADAKTAHLRSRRTSQKVSLSCLDERPPWRQSHAGYCSPSKALQPPVSFLFVTFVVGTPQSHGRSSTRSCTSLRLSDKGNDMLEVVSSHPETGQSGFPGGRT